MSIRTWRESRFSALISLVMLVCFFATLLPPRISRAQTAPPDTGPDGTTGPSDLSMPAVPSNSPEALSSVDLSTGSARASYAFALPKARGDAQPSLGLQYSSASGVGVAGVGWTLNVPSIVRKGAAGIPRFQDAALTSPNTLGTDLGTDDYYIDGRLLVPIAAMDTTPNLSTGETFPALPPLPSNDLGSPPLHWFYYRTEVDDGRRYFNGVGWYVQSKSGHILQFGIPPSSGSNS